MDSQKIPVSPAPQHLGEEFQMMYGAHRAAVFACQDVARLDRWIRRAVSAATVDDVFAEKLRDTVSRRAPQSRSVRRATIADRCGHAARSEDSHGKRAW